MGEDMLREASGNALTMAMIGCLPDNVQQAIKSFSIRHGSQHVSFAFPFMAEMLKRFRPDSYGGDTGVSQPLLTPGLFFDHSIDVIEGYQSYITLAPSLDRTVMPVVLFTLYQRDTVEGMVKHFTSLIKVLLDSKTLITVWKMPVVVVDLSSSVLELVVEACTQAILDIQMENLINTFPGKTNEQLFVLVKEKMVLPNFRGYQEHFECHVKEVASRLSSPESERFLAVVDHLRTVSCTAVDFQKADLIMKGPTSEPLIRAVWGIWGQDQVACKVFPIAMASGGVHKIGSLLYTVRGASGLDPALASLTNMPVKEGLQSIIKCLKAQDTAGLGHESLETFKGCSCHICKSSPRYCELRQELESHTTGPEELATQSAFYRPRPALTSRYHHTTTPYSDALKAAADQPGRTPGYLGGLEPPQPGRTPGYLGGLEPPQPGRTPGYLGGLEPPLSLLRTDFRRTIMAAPNTLAYLPGLSPFTMDSSAYRTALPLIYRPKIITHNFNYYRP